MNQEAGPVRHVAAEIGADREEPGRDGDEAHRLSEEHTSLVTRRCAFERRLRVAHTRRAYLRAVNAQRIAGRTTARAEGRAGTTRAARPGAAESPCPSRRQPSSARPRRPRRAGPSFRPRSGRGRASGERPAARRDRDRRRPREADDLVDRWRDRRGSDEHRRAAHRRADELDARGAVRPKTGGRGVDVAVVAVRGAAARGAEPPEVDGERPVAGGREPAREVDELAVVAQILMAEDDAGRSRAQLDPVPSAPSEAVSCTCVSPGRMHGSASRRCAEPDALVASATRQAPTHAAALIPATHRASWPVERGTGISLEISRAREASSQPRPVPGAGESWGAFPRPAVACRSSRSYHRRVGAPRLLAATASLVFVWTSASPGATAYRIPSDIASDCSTDATSAIVDWIDSVPDSSTLSFGTDAATGSTAPSR